MYWSPVVGCVYVCVCGPLEIKLYSIIISFICIYANAFKLKFCHQVCIHFFPSEDGKKSIGV